ncbi:MAG: MmgE/PrpD family protein, partial [Bryobacterales bacterium]|nr:MmgE/PrpD family protein [Bryobacterales bacterium]
ALTEDQAHIEVELRNGEKLEVFIEQSLGNVHRPMTDRELEGKFRDHAVPVLPASQVEKLIEFCWQIVDVEDCRTILV